MRHLPLLLIVTTFPGPAVVSWNLKSGKNGALLEQDAFGAGGPSDTEYLFLPVAKWEILPEVRLDLSLF